MRPLALKFSFNDTCKINVWILAFLWIIGLISGTILSHITEAYIVSLMRAAASIRVSIVWLVICNTFPLILTAFAVYFSIPVIAGCCVFVRALLFGFLVSALYISFHSGGWLVGVLLLFSFEIMNVLMLWLFLAADKIQNLSFSSVLAAIISASFVVTVVDYLYIAPYLVRIMDHF